MCLDSLCAPSATAEQVIVCLKLFRLLLFRIFTRGASRSKVSVQASRAVAYTLNRGCFMPYDGSLNTVSPAVLLCASEKYTKSLFCPTARFRVFP